MPLDSDALREALLTTFETAKEEEWETDQVAESLANAIHDYVSAADVVGVETTVELDIPAETGTGTQTGTGRLQ